MSPMVWVIFLIILSMNSRDRLKRIKCINLFPRILQQHFFPSLFPQWLQTPREAPRFVDFGFFLAVTDHPFLGLCKKPQLSWSQWWSFSFPWVMYMTLGMFVMEIILPITAQIFRKLAAFLRTRRYIKPPPCWLLCAHLKCNKGHSLPKNTVFVHAFLW